MHLCEFLSRWASVLGLSLDIAGAFLVYLGVRVSFKQAESLETIPTYMTIGDIGKEHIIEKASITKKARIEERLRAKKYSKLGLVFFVAGFLLQVLGSWPQ